VHAFLRQPIAIACRGGPAGRIPTPSLCHLAIADEVRQFGLDSLDLLVSRVGLGKEAVERPRLGDWLAVLRATGVSRRRLGARVKGAQLLTDLAVSSDQKVMSADK
jgi:hypothetical protein